MAKTNIPVSHRTSKHTTKKTKELKMLNGIWNSKLTIDQERIISQKVWEETERVFRESRAISKRFSHIKDRKAKDCLSSWYMKGEDFGDFISIHHRYEYLRELYKGERFLEYRQVADRIEIIFRFDREGKMEKIEHYYLFEKIDNGYFIGFIAETFFKDPRIVYCEKLIEVEYEEEDGKKEIVFIPDKIKIK
jgi:hypothetical protein